MRNVILKEDIEKVASTLRPLFMALKGRRIFLTGGTGFFGKWMAHSFLRMRQACGADMSLTILSRNPQRFLEAYPSFSEQDGLDFIVGDVRSVTFPARRTFDLVVHGATAASMKLEQENPSEMYSVITQGTRRILELARQCEAQRLLFMSSGAVYGPQPPDLTFVPETYEGTPSTVYGKGKKISEQMCIDAAAGHFECVIARPFAFVGPYLPLDAHFAIGNFIRDVLMGNPITIESDGSPFRSYQYAADLAEWLWTILLKGVHARPYNVGSAEAVSIRDLARKVRDCAGVDVPIMIRNKTGVGLLVPRYVPSTERANSELGLKVRCPLEDAIRRTLAWHRDLNAEGSDK